MAQRGSGHAKGKKRQLGFNRRAKRPCTDNRREVVFGRKQERSRPDILCVWLRTTGRRTLRGALAFDDAAQAAHLKSPRLLKRSVRPNSTIRLVPLGLTVNENVLLKERPDMHLGASGCSLLEKNNLRVERIVRGPVTLENFVLYEEREDEEFSLSMPKGSCS
jgi:hypothetical protein